MTEQFQVSTNLRLNNKTYEIVGIDTYCLFNHLGQKVKWKSYTLVCDKERIGLSFMNGSFFLWDEAPLETFPSKLLRLDLSGMAHITFEGDNGPSTPVAELIWFETPGAPEKNYLIESFLVLGEGKTLQSLQTLFQLGIEISGDGIEILK